MSRNGVLIFFTYIILAFIAYRSCFDILIPAENYSSLYLFEREGAAGIMSNIDQSAPYFVAYPVLYFLYQVFGINPSAWIVTALALHIFNAYLVFLVARQLMKLVLNEERIMIPFFAGLLFLISPYQTEEVLWALRWGFHSTLALAGILLTINHLAEPSRGKLFAIHLFFLLGIFSNELTLVCPLIYTVFFVLLRKLGRSPISIKSFLTHLILPQLIILSAYFLGCKLVMGHWFFHGGTLHEISQTTDYFKTLLKYFAKFILFYRYLSLDQLDELLRALSENRWIIVLSAALVFIAAIAMLWRFTKSNKEWGYFFIALLSCFIISLLPVLSLDSSFLNYIYPDRYGYLPSAFFYIFLALVAYSLSKKLTMPLLIGYSILCWIFLSQTISVWSATNDYCNSLTENYKPFQNFQRVYVLNVPTYYRGVAAFRSAFAETVYMKNNSPTENIRVISGCYQESDSDTVTAITFTGNSVSVSGPKKKTPYFSTSGGWARSYSTREYDVIFNPTGCAYTMVFKEKIPENSAFIYTSGGIWKKAG